MTARSPEDRAYRDRSGLDAATRDVRIWPVLARVIRDYALPRRRLIAVAVACMVYNAVATGLLPVLLRDSADRIFIGRDLSYLYVLPPVIIFVMVTRALADYVASVHQGYLATLLVADLRKQLFRKFVHADMNWLHSTHSGRLISVFMGDVNLVNMVATQSLTSLFQNLLQVVFLTGSMFFLDWRMSLFVIAVVPLGALLIRAQRRRTRRSVVKTLHEMGSLGTVVSEMLKAIRVVKAYDQQAYEVARAERIVDRAVALTQKTIRARNAARPISEGLAGVGIGLAILFGGWQGIEGHLTLGQFMGFITAALLAYQPFKALAGLSNQLLEGALGAARIFHVLDRVDATDLRETAPELRVTRGAIRFEQVSFSYEDGEPVLHDVSLDIPAGTRIALVGPSGAGKSTIVNLLLRFYDPSSGRILVDGQDIRQAQLGSVRRASALLTQDPVLFDDTIAANIRYGSTGASDDDVVAAARSASAHDFITALPKGYATEVGEAGLLMSGGQKQRIAFARAFLRNAPILLLDEPTSALDADSEARIQAVLDVMAADRTVLIIAHRLSTIRNADMIVAMEAGRVVETGRHDELLALDGLYARLYRTQFATNPAEAPGGEGAP